MFEAWVRGNLRGPDLASRGGDEVRGHLCRDQVVCSEDVLREHHRILAAVDGADHDATAVFDGKFPVHKLVTD
eukprot:CAMPEP_0181331572 /NCGR_PEP_ID=MMETSP1101-20121128/24578_1 /TAXON_ID=46948 /ORGANISM="Rhodomonas abbreviata, Strain Caron Lab Isolate" /LENGTH=72 /DNA_ID=CAMNT_0023441051 /DNA_START=261 /DNA_END=476 /DNA_ORIENTATION=+